MLPQRRKKARRVDPDRCPQHLQWLRGFLCSVAGCKDGPIDAHHVRLGSHAGLSIKPPDDRAIPLCHAHHMLLDSPGWSEARFYREHKVNTDELIAYFTKNSPPLRRRRAA